MELNTLIGVKVDRECMKTALDAENPCLDEKCGLVRCFYRLFFSFYSMDSIIII